MSVLKSSLKSAWPIVFAAITGGCAAGSNEVRYFATIDSQGVPVNYFRLTVTPGATFGNVRYMSGYYDERAVDLFLNENKVSTDKQGSIKPLFDTNICTDQDDAVACRQKIDNRLRLVPVGGTNTSSNQAFIMILSSNAGAVSETIGSFAGNETVLKNLMFLANKDRLTEAAKIAATSSIVNADRASTYKIIDAILDSASAADNRAAREQSYVMLLQTAAREIGSNADFTTFDGAKSAINGAPK